MQTIHADFNQSYALLFDLAFSDEHPVGMIGPDDCNEAIKPEDVIAAAGKWVHEALEWDSNRKAVVYYFAEGGPIWANLVISTRLDNPQATVFKIEGGQG